MLKVSGYLRKVISVKINPTKKTYTEVKSMIPVALLFYKDCVPSNENVKGTKCKHTMEFCFPVNS